MLGSFPISLSPSPVHLAFEGIQGDPIDKLSLSAPEKALIRTAEENVLEYTLEQQSEAEAYAQILLKLLDAVTKSSPKESNQRVHKLPLDVILPDDEALPLLYVDTNGVLTHYLIQRLCDVILSLKENDSLSNSNIISKKKVTLASVFYPNGILVENTRSLLRLLVGGRVDVFAQRGAAFCLSCLLLQGQELDKQHRLMSPIASILESFVSWMTSRLQSGAPQAITMLTPAMTVIIVDQQTRGLLDTAGGIGYLARNLQIKHSASVQQLYELAYCLWVLSYDVNDNETLRTHFHRDGAVPALVDLVVAATREKVVRVALSSLCNLATCDPQYDTATSTNRRTLDGQVFLNEMIGCGLLKGIDLLKQRTWNDDDFIEDLNKLHSLLRATAHDMTRWDVYVAEVDSGHLQWGMVHTEKFFQENAQMMEGPNGDFVLVKRLIKLAASDNDDVAAVACYDLGEFARFYPNGRAIAKRLGVRSIVMHLMDSPNEELQRQALLCISKILVQNWQHVK